MTATAATARPAASATEPASAAEARPRVQAIDIIRGVVMVLMAIDHVRVYSGVPPGGPTPGVFFTRWVTHFCAPAFVFLAGTGAFLYRERVGDTGKVSRFLVTRGIWLVLLELTLLRIAWTFNLDYGHYVLAGVIWMLGWCMILMAGLIYLPFRAIAALGVGIVALHNVTDFFEPALRQSAMQGSASWLWKLLYFGGPISLGGGENGPTMAVLYVIVPWIGVMCAGYAFGAVYRLDSSRRRKACLTIGATAVALFLILRGLNLYGDPRGWSGAQGPAILSFLATNKYPASFLFLLMTLGPTILAVPLLENARGRIARALQLFGQVPLFYYILHIPLIHVLALVVAKIRSPGQIGWLFDNHPMMNAEPPDGYVWSLPLLYLVFAVAVTILYFACRWFAAVKARRRDWWLSYL